MKHHIILTTKQAIALRILAKRAYVNDLADKAILKYGLKGIEVLDSIPVEQKKVKKVKAKQ